jgi:hypothetical protein
VPVSTNNDILCYIKGVVSHDFICTKYKTTPQVKHLNQQKNRCIDCTFFIENSSTSESLPSMGFCQLFTVREFNGENKNACSKFCKKSELIVS